MSLSDSIIWRETWYLAEAAIYLAGDDPALVGDQPYSFDVRDIERVGGRAADVFRNLTDAAQVGTLPTFLIGGAGYNPYRVRPRDAVAWAKARGDEIPEALNALAELQLESKAVAAPPAEKPLATTERNTLLTIVAALCDYSAIEHQERGAASRVAAMTQEIGAPVTDDTVRRVLAQIPEALERRKK